MACGRYAKLGLLALAMGAATFANRLLTAPAGAEEVVEQSAPAKPADRVREGTELVDVAGYFKLTGDRATFCPLDGSGRFLGLENQTLERVATVTGEDPTPLEWLVSGTITEFRGSNYILITRAILKTKPPAGSRSPGKPVAKPKTTAAKP